MYVSNENRTTDIFGSPFDNIICCGDERFLRSCSKMEDKFETKKKVFKSFEFSGTTVDRTDYGYNIAQCRNTTSLKKLAKGVTI